MAVKAKGKLKKSKPVKAVKKSGRPTKKKKPEEQALPMRAPTRTAGDSNVPTAEIKSVMEDTFERVYEEMFPRMQLRDEKDRLVLSLAEDAYVIRLYMLVGSPEDSPRRSLKFRKHEYKRIPDCGRHDD